MKSEKTKSKSWIKTIAVVIAILIIFGSMAIVNKQNNYSIVRQFGKVVRVETEPGLTFKVPLIQSVSTLPKTVMFYDLAPSEVITKDKKNMVVDSFVLWRITDPLKFIQSLNGQISNAESRLNTIVYNSTKNIISSISQEQIISGRDGELVKAIKDNIGDTFSQYGIELTAVETKQIDLPDSNKAAVYERMISERNNIAAQYTAEGLSEATKIKTEADNDIRIKMSEAESESERIISEGEAEYMKILSSVYNNPSKADFYKFVISLDALKSTMVGDNKTVILDADSPIAKIFKNIE